jgi:hypothetical protein
MDYNNYHYGHLKANGRTKGFRLEGLHDFNAQDNVVIVDSKIIVHSKTNMGYQPNLSLL